MRIVPALILLLLAAGCAYVERATTEVARVSAPRIDDYCSLPDDLRKAQRDKINAETERYDVELVCTLKGPAP